MNRCAWLRWGWLGMVMAGCSGGWAPARDRPAVAPVASALPLPASTSRAIPASPSTLAGWSNALLGGVTSGAGGPFCASSETRAHARTLLASAGAPARITMTSLLLHLWEPLGDIDEAELAQSHPGGKVIGIEVTAYAIPTRSGELRWLRLDGARAKAPDVRMSPRALSAAPWRTFEPAVSALVAGLEAKPCRIAWLRPSDADAIPASDAALRASIQPHPDFERQVCPWIAMSAPRWVVTRLGVGLALEAGAHRQGLNGTFDLRKPSPCFAELDAYSRDE
jgi:hypothetical protein